MIDLRFGDALEIDEKYYNIAKDRLNGVYQKEVNLDSSPLFN